ncbi:hypothetical protein [Desulfofarcimen acetoxidans]|uniref:hypothetical protein n=1 Tax=Desulfofarcimen acetoxidans TaxID=58138 RepID=UPI00019E52B1|nr:hypothetical protein [Desulfofarcimen acetoxidans]
MANISLKGYGESDKNIGQVCLNSEEILESRSIRDKYASRVEVLDKVKKLSMLPDDIHVTIEMAANYYEVDSETIKKITQRHREELESDGQKIIKGQELQSLRGGWGHGP